MVGSGHLREPYSKSRRVPPMKRLLPNLPLLLGGACSIIGRASMTVLMLSAAAAAEPADVNYDESRVPEYSLPPVVAESVPEENALDFWKNSRRAEVLSLFERHVYGKTPRSPVNVCAEVVERDDDALGGAAVRRQVRLTLSPMPDSERDAKRSITINLLIYTPAKSKQRVPAFIGLNFFGNQTVHSDPGIRISESWMRQKSEIGIVDNRATEQTRGKYSERWQAEMLVRRGYGLVTAYYGDIDPDNYRSDFSDGAHPLFYESGQTEPAADEWGAIGAWAWGLSTIRQWLEGDELVNANRLAVIGHSRLGKTALWAGAQDQNFAAVISNNSGCGGAALYRRCYGERIHHMLSAIGYWFCRDHAQFAQREVELPVDQHMLLALIAPRPLYVASATEDQWADPIGEFLAAKHGSSIYELFGTTGLQADSFPAANQPSVGRIGYHLRKGEHAVTEYDWRQYLDFADRHL